MSPNGRHLRQPDARLARRRRLFPAGARTGARSPSGAPRIADTTSDQEIFVMNADGSTGRQVTFNTVDDRPAWSPDGRKIVFERA